MKNLLENNEVAELSNELIYRHYLLNRGKIRELFCEMTLAEYIALHMIASESKSSISQ